MRIAVCGTDKQSVIEKIENNLEISVKKPWVENSIIDTAAETYKYFNDKNVVFDGTAFDFLPSVDTEGVSDVYEQIALGTLSNLDYIVVLTLGMDRATLKMYEEYSVIAPEKFYFYETDRDFEIVMR